MSEEQSMGALEKVIQDKAVARFDKRFVVFLKRIENDPDLKLIKLKYQCPLENKSSKFSLIDMLKDWHINNDSYAKESLLYGSNITEYRESLINELKEDMADDIVEKYYNEKEKTNGD